MQVKVLLQKQGTAGTEGNRHTHTHTHTHTHICIYTQLYTQLQI